MCFCRVPSLSGRIADLRRFLSVKSVVGEVAANVSLGGVSERDLCFSPGKHDQVKFRAHGGKVKNGAMRPIPSVFSEIDGAFVVSQAEIDPFVLFQAGHRVLHDGEIAP